MALPLRRIDTSRLEELEHMASLARTMSLDANNRAVAAYQRTSRIEHHIGDHQGVMASDVLQQHEADLSTSRIKLSELQQEHGELAERGKAVRALLTRCSEYAQRMAEKKAASEFAAQSTGEPSRVQQVKFDGLTSEMKGGDIEYR